MPTVFRQEGFRFHFYSDEGAPREPVHIHVEKAGLEAKFWVGEDVELAYNHGFDRRAIAKAIAIVRARKADVTGAWHGHFS